MTMPIFDKKTKTYYSHYATVEQWVSKALEKPQGGHTGYMSKRQAFNGQVNAKDLSARIRDMHADKDTMRMIQEQLEVMPDTVEGSTPELQVYNDMMGFSCDTLAQSMGEVEDMFQYELAPNTQKNVWIACSFGALSNAEPEQFRNRGTALIRAVKYLQAQSVNVGLIAYSMCDNARFHCQTPDGHYMNYHAQTIVVKRPQDELDETTLVNMFTLPATLRTLGFNIRQHDCGDFNGATETIHKELFQYTDLAQDEVLVLAADPHMYNFASPEQGANHIQNQLERITD